MARSRLLRRRRRRRPVGVWPLLAASSRPPSVPERPRRQGSAATRFRRSPIDPPGAAARPSPAATASLPAAVAAPAADECFSSAYAGLLFLLNAFVALGLYPDFAEPRRARLEPSPLWLADRIGRFWFGAAYRRDPLCRGSPDRPRRAACPATGGPAGLACQVRPRLRPPRLVQRRPRHALACSRLSPRRRTSGAARTGYPLSPGSADPASSRRPVRKRPAPPSGAPDARWIGLPRALSRRAPPVRRAGSGLGLSSLALAGRTRALRPGADRPLQARFAIRSGFAAPVSTAIPAGSPRRAALSAFGSNERDLALRRARAGRRRTTSSSSCWAPCCA